MSNSEGDKSYTRFFGEKYSRVSREEIDTANRDLARGIDTFEASDLLSRAEKAGQYLRRDTYFPEGSEFVGTQLTTELGFSDYDKKLKAERGSVEYRLDEDMQTIVSVETPSDPKLNIIRRRVGDVKSPVVQLLFEATNPASSK